MFRNIGSPLRLRARLGVESLEDRCLLSANVLQTNLVSDLPGVAQVRDPNLVNPWGLSEGPSTPFWVSDNGANVATLYNGQGTPQALVVSIPSPGDLTGTSGTPTGTVFNIAANSGAFPITDGTHAAPAIFLFATEDGTIVGWNPTVDPTGKFDGPKGFSTHAVIAVDHSAIPSADNGAVYKGLAIATDSSGRTLLYATNFRSGAIDVFDTSFHMVTNLPTGAFTDPNLPAGYAPFDVQELGGKIYVTYALQDAAKHDDVAGAGHGFVDVYNLDGTPGLAGNNVRLVSQGQLNSPWGLAIAPSSFGTLAGSLLVGNFGDGRIHAYNASTGTFLAELDDPDGEPIQIDGLWALKVGNGAAGGDTDKIYFTAGLFHESHGLFGSLTPVQAGTPEGSAEREAVIAALDVFKLDLKTLITDIHNHASGDVIQQDRQTVANDRAQFMAAVLQFAKDQRQDHGHSVHGSSVIHASQTPHNDLLDNLFANLGRVFHDFH